jgi:hypothetical protein
LLVLAAAAFWVFQLAQLMSLRDDQFASRFDKYIWIALFLLTYLLAAAAFWLWNRQRVAGKVRRLSTRVAESGVHMPAATDESPAGN